MKTFAVRTTENNIITNLIVCKDWDDANGVFLRRAVIMAANRGKAPADLLRDRRFPTFTWGNVKIEIVEYTM